MMPDLPTILISSGDLAEVRSALPIHAKPDDGQQISGPTGANLSMAGDNGYNISENPDSPQRRRPPPSRHPSEDLLPRLASEIQAPSSQIEGGSVIQRSQTDLYNSSAPSNWGNGVDPIKKLSRSSTAGTVGPRSSKRAPDLNDLIISAMSELGEVGLETPESYISHSVLSSFMTDDCIKRTLTKSSKYISYAKQNPRVLAITALAHSTKDSRNKAMKAFQKNNFTDASLPVEKLLNKDVCSVQFNYDSDSDCELSDSAEFNDEESSACRHSSKENAFHGAPWSKSTFKVFFESQWSFLVPQIEEKEFEYYFRDNIILPLQNRQGDSGTRVDGGHFGDVRLAMMLADHQTAMETDDRLIPVAIKEMKLHTGHDYNNFENWKREAKALRVFNLLKNPHIVTGIGAFKQHQKYFILMEWADGGDLGNVWKSMPDPHLTLTENRVAQFLEQFRGLANALKQMHVYKIVSTGDSDGLVVPKEEQHLDETTIASRSLDPSKNPLAVEATETQNLGFDGPGFIKPETIPQSHEKLAFNVTSIASKHSEEQHVHFTETDSGITIVEPSKTTENWRHGDLKPDNILSFRAKHSSDWLGRLKLADVGRAKQHMDKTGKRIGTAEVFTTLHYDPPEVWTSLDKGRSRLVDIWSFGCVLLETVIWLLFGFNELSTFRTSVVEIGSLYWSVQVLHTKTAMLNQRTFEWINRLLKEDAECQPRESGSALRDLVLLITNRLLVIKLPVDSEVNEESCRANCEALVQELDTIIDMGKKDSKYLFSGKDRAGMKMPQVAVVKENTSQLLSPDMKLSGANVAQTRTPAPLEFRPSSQPSERNDSYLHDFDDKWKYVDDNVFASQALQRADIELKQLSMTSMASILCDNCRFVDLNAPDVDIKYPIAELRRRKNEQRCDFCTILLRTAENSGYKDWVEFDVVASGLRMSRRPGLPALTIRRTQAEVDLSSGRPSHIQIGFPKIPTGGSPGHFGIIRAWIEDCDQNHIDCQPKGTISLPTRIIDVGTIEAPSLRLVESASLPTAENETLKYIALSYPWGTSPPHQHVVTNVKVAKIHAQEIPNPLPKTLADAVTTCRHLKVRYLWIDSLCIIQGLGGDFAQEADRMEAVFSSAYFVIAATSAEGSSSGFLNRNSRREINAMNNAESEHPKPVYFPDRAGTDGENGFIIVDEPFDDFDRDVLHGPLNQRGWVFQERALARRTIHFTNNQTYWECGDGIRCETLSKLRNTRVGFLGDPNFPTYGMRGSRGGDIVFYEDLYEQYSRLSFSKIEDRPFAISGLEQRLSQALKAKGSSGQGYWGIFDAYWGRGLLWRRGTDEAQMVRLKAGASGGEPAPSWSWEGYSGGITFMKPEPRTVEWLANEVTLPWSLSKLPQSQMTTASYRGDRCLKGTAHDFTLPNERQSAQNSYDIVYDDGASRMSRGPLKVMVVGRMKVESRPREKVRNYVLVIARKESAPGKVYERVGAGFVDGSLIDFDKEMRNVLVE